MVEVRFPWILPCGLPPVMRPSLRGSSHFLKAHQRVVWTSSQMAVGGYLLVQARTRVVFCHPQ